jgi:hypothetical protein
MRNVASMTSFHRAPSTMYTVMHRDDPDLSPEDRALIDATGGLDLSSRALAVAGWLLNPGSGRASDVVSFNSAALAVVRRSWEGRSGGTAVVLTERAPTGEPTGYAVAFRARRTQP